MMKKKVSIVLILFCLLSFFRVIFLNMNYENKYFEEQRRLRGKIIDIQKENDKVVFVLKSDIKYKLTSYKKFYYQLGDIVLVNATVYSASNNTVFNLYNYNKYLLSENIEAIGEVKEIKIIKENKNIFYMLKSLVINHIEKYKSEKYLKTFVLADQSKIEDDVKESYRNLGISHLFSVSGMHVSLFMFVINKLLKRFKYKNCFIFVFIAFYLFLTGFPPSLLRCILFLIINYFNKKLRLNYKGEYILIVVAFLLLLFNSYLIYNVGFLFSVTITFYILLISKNIKSDSYIIKNFKISLVAFLASVPILAFSFFKVNLISVLYNIILVPIVSFFIFPFSLFTFFVPLFDKVYFILINLFETLSLFLGNLRLFNITISKPHFIIFVFYYLSLFLTIKFDKRIIIIYIIIFLLNVNIRFFIINSQITFLDAGQGDSLIMIFPKGKCILIDTGGNFNYSVSKSKIIPYLNSIGINKINMLVLTHGDYDHMGEAINLVNNFKIEKVIFNCGEFNELKQDLIKVLDKKKIPYYSCIKELNIDDNKLYFLNNGNYDNENDNSSVIYTELNNHKFLFMGDAGVEVEEDLIKKYNLQNIAVLKVGHHGSKTSSSKTFINETNPKYSIISVGKNNRYGHPNDIVLDNLEDSKIYRTDQDGSIMFKIKKSKLEIESCVP